MAIIVALQIILYFRSCLMGGLEETNEIHGTKRLLLNDPNAINNRLNNLERSLQQQQATMLQQQTTLLQHETTIQKQQATIQEQQATIQQLKQNKPHDQGSTYIQWGKTSCSSMGTETVYSGYTAGQEHESSSYANRFGGAANMLCLPNNPKLSNKTAPGNSFIFGTEFEENFLRSDAVNEDIPCALCRSINTTSSVMFPGRNVCYNGWKKEYEGYVMSGYWGHRASSYICVDLHPDYVPGGKSNTNGQLLYVTSTKCGTLTCPPYNDNMAVNCVVCSK
ncbi:uncharacterized protein LOC143044224 [Mytilus galloprovincialis]|uniref:uncharacterized protein LOC143044224 n=1 Tax=Mytilus galloprovincialis TaxID=29158 RepID=UPI003F7BE452